MPGEATLKVELFSGLFEELAFAGSTPWEISKAPMDGTDAKVWNAPSVMCKEMQPAVVTGGARLRTQHD